MQKNATLILNLEIQNFQIMRYQKNMQHMQTFFKELCRTGLKKRYGDNPSKVAQDRLEYEISVIEKNGIY